MKSPYLINALKYVKFPREARMKEADDISAENQVFIDFIEIKFQLNWLKMFDHR